MKLFWGAGKILMVAFWLVVLTGSVIDVPRPFGIMINLAGILILLTHLVELILFNGSLRGRRHPWRDRGKIILFGVFHIQSIGRPAAERTHA
ncbi:DUF1145 domain-containing protein [Pseudomonas sp. R1-18]|uniref:DUF1145 domain-containing protein n=1 Tax=Pseudomonas sp. R1-18 TaxID=1632772 RepID=UPI003DA89292